MSPSGAGPPGRILLAVHSARTGGAQLMALAAAGRLGREHDLHIAVPDGPLRPEFARHGTIVRSSPTMTLGWGSRGRWLLQALRSALDGVRIAAHVRRHRIGAVYVNSLVLLGPVIGARLAGVPAVVHARELAPDRRGRALFAAQVALADTVIAVSDAVERGLPRRRRARVVRIYDGVVLPDPPARRDGFHSPLRLCLVGTVGGDRRKGQDLAVAALAQLRRAGVEARLELVGPVADRRGEEELRALAGSLGIAEQVALVGATDRVHERIADADIVLSCAREEPLGLTVMEALALECPVVATAVGGIPEIVRHGETGVLVAAGDPAAVASAIEALVSDPATARAMARRGRRDVQRRFARRAGLDALERLLDDRLPRPAARVRAVAR